MLLKLISCNVFLREACSCIARSPHVIDVEFTELGEHVNSASLRAAIQQRIDAAESSAKVYDAILLLFGLCGNATVRLRAAKTRLVIPRAHDCCTILLGSKKTFQEHFQAAPSTPFSSSGYVERGSYFLRTEDGQSSIGYGDEYAGLVEKYGEDNARYVWESMHPPGTDAAGNKAVFIEIPETSHLDYAEVFRRKAAAAGKTCVQLEGSLRLIEKLVGGNWDAEDFLVVEAGREIAGVYDWSEIVRAR